ncbi:MAG: hypothetical protein AAF570_17315 [Bacteroidota bacterium]
MKQFWFCFALLLLTNFTFAQSHTPEYFSESMLKEEGVRTVSIYETWIEDPVGFSGHKNMIRLAKNLISESYYNESGKRTRALFYRKDSETIRDYVLYHYDGQGRLSQRDYHYPKDESDGGDMLVRHDKYAYGKGDQVAQQVVSQDGDKKEVITDSTLFDYDGQGRVKTEMRHVLANGQMKPGLSRNYNYKGARETVILIMSGEVLLGKEIKKYDDAGNLVSSAYFHEDDFEPRYAENYKYDPRGWLEEVTYDYDWNHHKRSEVVVSRKNKYDDHGKLVEAQMDYGNGRRLMRYVDYVYYVAEK